MEIVPIAGWTDSTEFSCTYEIACAIEVTPSRKAGFAPVAVWASADLIKATADLKQAAFVAQTLQIDSRHANGVEVPGPRHALASDDLHRLVAV